jgi:hypothetical protein
MTYDSKLLKQPDRIFTRTPRRRRPTPRLLPREVLNYLNALRQHIPLLLLAQCAHKLMRIAV